MFSWIRNKVRDAVLSGIVDAMDYLDGETKGLRQDAMGTLESRYKLLPASIVLNSHQNDDDIDGRGEVSPTVKKRGKAS